MGGALAQIKGQSTPVRELIAWNLPKGDVRWHVLEEKQDRIADLAVRPNGQELATKCTGDVTIWSMSGKVLRRHKSPFLAGPIVYSPDGKIWISPAQHTVHFRHSGTGKSVGSLSLPKNSSAEAAGFISDTQVLLAASVIDARGHTSGVLSLFDLIRQAKLKSSRLDFRPNRIAVDPKGRWACVAGERRGRGYLLFWDLKKWSSFAGQGAHGSSVAGLAISPDGSQLATTGDDHKIRIWDTAQARTINTLDKHRAEGDGPAGIAWSPNGKYLAFTSLGASPDGGVYVYEWTDDWRLMDFGPDPAAPSAAPDGLRHLQVFGEDMPMDTYGNFNLPANPLPVKCPLCTMVDLNAVPSLYLLRRSIESAGDFRTAEMGNFFVREQARRVLEIAAPGACQCFPTFHAQSKAPTDWFLAVPQTHLPTAKLPVKCVRCRSCGEPKIANYLEPLPVSCDVDVYKSSQWTCSKIGEETEWYRQGFLKVPRNQIPRAQWTRLGLRRELWMSTRLLLLMKQLKLRGSGLGVLHNQRPTPAEASWIARQLEAIHADSAAPVKPARLDVSKWFRNYLRQRVSKRPLSTRGAVAAWEQQHDIKLPASYINFVTTVGRHTFADAFGDEGFSFRVVGPRGLDPQEYRRDPPIDESNPEPDGLSFAEAVNGDVLCFDLRSLNADFAVFHFDHETCHFEPFANNFALAIRRLVNRE